ncbi:MAG: hypothetical protein P4L56_25625 [Candidatus Sulfopaludibacter sp.]|nr:hypothetical protein [Candidatus Sulfopaludibacter sp.]
MDKSLSIYINATGQAAIDTCLSPGALNGELQAGTPVAVDLLLSDSSCPSGFEI